MNDYRISVEECYDEREYYNALQYFDECNVQAFANALWCHDCKRAAALLHALQAVEADYIQESVKEYSKY